MQQQSRESARAGITLMELLLVVAIVSIMASLAVPNLLRTFIGQKLDKSADIVRAEMGRARVQAIRTGKVFAFVYNVDQSQLAVRSFDQLVQAGSVDHFVNSGRDDQRSSNMDYSGENLPKGVRFAAGQALDDVRSEYETEAAGGSSAQMKPILFYPDGTSQDAQVILVNEAGDVVRVVLRGLTGTARVVRMNEQ